MIIELLAAAFLNVSEQKFTITEPYQMNIGSSAAALSLCEKESYIPIGGSADIMLLLNKKLIENDYRNLVRYFQQTIYQKSLYSVHHGRWISFRVDESNCRDIYKMQPVLIDFISKW